MDFDPACSSPTGRLRPDPTAAGNEGRGLLGRRASLNYGLGSPKGNSHDASPTSSPHGKPVLQSIAGESMGAILAKKTERTPRSSSPALFPPPEPSAQGRINNVMIRSSSSAKAMLGAISTGPRPASQLTQRLQAHQNPLGRRNSRMLSSMDSGELSAAMRCTSETVRPLHGFPACA